MRKNRIFLVGMVILILSLGLVFVGCDNETITIGTPPTEIGDPDCFPISITNHHTDPITAITVIAEDPAEAFSDITETGLNIVKGSTWTGQIFFSMPQVKAKVEVTTSGGTVSMSSIVFAHGKWIAFTLNNATTLTFYSSP